MQSWLPTAVGMVAGCCSTAAFVPQVLKIRREGDTRAISARMYVLRDLGFVLWLAYGLALGSVPLVVFNAAAPSSWSGEAARAFPRSFRTRIVPPSSRLATLKTTSGTLPSASP